VDVQSNAGELVTCDIDDGVAVLTWNRPERRNSWSVPMKEEYFALLRRCTADPGVRAIVVTGAGSTFCPGMDSGALSGSYTGATETRPQDRQPAIFPATVPKPMIAAINGACAGLGLNQALMCDVRIAGAGVKFTTAFARRGIMAEHGIAWMLPRIIGTGRAMDLLLSARVFLAEEALELGLVNQVVPREQVLDAAVAYARAGRELFPDRDGIHEAAGARRGHPGPRTRAGRGTAALARRAQEAPRLRRGHRELPGEATAQVRFLGRVIGRREGARYVR
jgi:enoyl-CoA hydratase/carnithine racemase